MGKKGVRKGKRVRVLLVELMCYGASWCVIRELVSYVLWESLYVMGELMCCGCTSTSSLGAPTDTSRANCNARRLGLGLDPGLGLVFLDPGLVPGPGLGLDLGPVPGLGLAPEPGLGIGLASELAAASFWLDCLLVTMTLSNTLARYSIRSSISRGFLVSSLGASRSMSWIWVYATWPSPCPGAFSGPSPCLFCVSPSPCTGTVGPYNSAAVEDVEVVVMVVETSAYNAYIACGTECDIACGQ